MKLSVILPCYNGEKTIAVQLESLAKQQWGGTWELIVVNNGSTDHSMEIVEGYRDRLPHLRIVNAYTPPGPRLGVAHSYNTGVQAADGDAVAFCEADDEVATDWLAQMAEALAQHQCVAGALEYTRLNEPWILEANGNGAQSEALIVVKHKPYLSFAYGCNLGMKRSVYETVGEFDTSFPCAWDMDYSFRVQLAGIPLHFAPQIVVHYRIRHTWRDIYRQARRWGEDNPLIRKRYGVGMGKLELFRRTFALLQHLLHKPPVSKRAAFSNWLFSFGWQVGEVQGLLKHFLFSFFTSPQRSSVVPQHKQEIQVH
ncbi:glycosyltransferase [Leptolyngbya sp. FACHB-321]|uniref:glycosyltransferase n=1 Tax=Leptolyngbya sp. FACHB-321 TaxID=2692807 RepID=UPI001689CA19|nr:glycosyltransferase [Leptolyngbya sp. FACHB-321]MBD2034613.1 glycosyltransferase [Leptolyngbya sp. FACHB-321]